MAVERLSSAMKSQPRSGDEIRAAFLEFFAERGHKVLPSASLVPDDPTVLLTIAGMLPFKPVFLGHEKRPSPRVTTSQKCIRTNDIENVGCTARHQTFFEMLGNFSFGDYFKQEAIVWAWELSTDVLGLNPKNLIVSVFRDDDEAEEIWKNVVGLDSSRIIRMGEADNFWSSGPTGPCGPCSEIYYDFHPELGDKNIDLEDDSRFIEFYNLVFMEYNRDSEGKLTSLANRNIDTGMGLERMAQILQEVPNNYETDLIYPLLEKAASLAEVNYQELEEKRKTSFKVIGDHVRACVQLIADGVVASNLGRGYILRRLLRRVIRHGRLIGIKKPFLIDIGNIAIELMGSAYPLLIERQNLILKELQREELRFLETLERGEKLLEDLLATKPNEITGAKAFELYDTYGFPLELTQEIAQENLLKVDLKGFEKEMNKQRKLAKAANRTIDLTLQESIDIAVREINPTNFKGYNNLEENTVVQAILIDGNLVSQAQSGEIVQLVLEVTPFYGEGGGQIGDVGFLYKESSSNCMIEIKEVTRNNNVFIHTGVVKKGILNVGDIIHCQVCFASRRRAQINHTATHLLQAALKAIIDSDISQAGSLVSFDRLRFDFHCATAIKKNQLEEIEKLINCWIGESHTLLVQEMPLEDAKAAGAVAMFGEKYGDEVRVVDVPGVSMELCGGTHVTNTGELGTFKIISESGIAAGIRRIEAVAGPGVLDYFNERDVVVNALCERFKTKPQEVVDRVVALQDEVKSLSKLLVKAQEEIASAKTSILANKVVPIGNSQYLVSRLDGVSGDALQSAAQELVHQLGENSAVLLAGIPNSNESKKVVFIAAFGLKVVASGLHAGKFLGPIAKICGGGGGGRPHFAQAGGRDSKNLEDALDLAKNRLIDELH